MHLLVFVHDSLLGLSMLGERFCKKYERKGENPNGKKSITQP